MFSRSIVLEALFIAVLACLLSGNVFGEATSGVKGTVLDTAEHAPIRNAYILAHRNGGTDKSFRTDERGRYVIELLPSTYDILISADGFAPTCRKIQIPRSGMLVFDAILNVSNVNMQESSSSGQAAGSPRGIAGDIPGGLPPDGSRPIGGLISSEPQSHTSASPARVRVAEKVMRAFLVTKVNPDYPPQAEKQHVDGTVLLHINIDKSGNVSRVDPVSGHPLLIPSAVEAVKQWKYRPYLLNQKPVEVETTVLIKFVRSEGDAYSVIAFASCEPK
jgi:TonB family protein